jgi:hypothetical protein
MRDFPEMIAAFSAFGVLVLCPLVFMLLKHQRAMAEIVHRGGDDLTKQRLDMMEHELRQLRAAQHEVLVKLDDQQALVQRIESYK